MSRRLSAEAIANALGGHRSGRGYVARCPAHDDQTPSLSITDAADAADDGLRTLVKCHAGCTQGEVIAALRALGLWNTSGASDCRRFATHRSSVREATRGSDKIAYAMTIWGETVPAEGTVVETYLKSRGITIKIPKSIRFHEDLRHSQTRTSWPALVALITNGAASDPIGILRIFLARDGLGKAPVHPQKMMLGKAAGGVVRLGEASELILVGEGIETCLSVMQATGQPVWAALSTSGLTGLQLPPHIRDVTILADGDDPGERAAQAAARRLKMSVRSVRIVRPFQGADFNDMLNLENPHE